MIKSEALREAIGLGGQDIRARSRPAAGVDPGALQAGKRCLFGAEDIGHAGLLRRFSRYNRKANLDFHFQAETYMGSRPEEPLIYRGAPPYGPGLTNDQERADQALQGGT